MSINDFTKNELIKLKKLTRQHVNQFRENSDCIDLLNKIQSMIENYCEHDWQYNHHDQGHCRKCGLIHENQTR